MKTKSLLRILGSVLLFGASYQVASAVNDSIPYKKLIISEVNTHGGSSWTEWSYIELTNVGDSTLDMSRFFMTGRYNNGAFPSVVPYSNNQKYSMKGTLKPGEVYLIAYPANNGSKTADGKLIYPKGYCIPSILSKARDIIPAAWDYNPGGLVGTSNGIALYCRIKATDSVLIDVFGDNVTTETPQPDSFQSPIAGNVGPISTNVYVRKLAVKEGNMGNWTQSRGTDIIDSEWFPVPKKALTDIGNPLFTTVGIHKDMPYSFSAKSPAIVIDDVAQKITVPYGTRRDSFAYYFNFGPNQTYMYTWGNDSVDFFCKNDDNFKLYYISNALTTKEYKISVLPKADNFGGVSSLRFKNKAGNWTSLYNVTYTNSVIDTISNIPFGTRVDTLLAYIVKAPGTTSNITFVDDITRPDLKNGDLLNIVPTTGAKKSYFLKVDDYIANYNPMLKNIILPGSGLFINKNYENTDTLEGFSGTTLEYFVNLPMDTKTAPAVIGVPVDSRSKVVVMKPKNIFGSAADRTATIKVTTEADSVWTYKLHFEVKREQPTIKGEPFFTDLGEAGWNSNFNIQIINPSNSSIDLTDYIMFVGSTAHKSLTDILKTINPATPNADPVLDWWGRNKNVLRFGYRFDYDQSNPAVSKSSEDLAQKTTTLGEFGYWWLCGVGAFPKVDGGTADQIAKIDMYHHWGALNSSQQFADQWGKGRTLFGTNLGWEFKNFNIALGIAKIVNDSVKDGIKLYRDEKDFQIVDFVNRYGSSATTSPYLLISGKDTVKIVKGTNFLLSRKSWVNTGNPNPGEAFGSPVSKCEWSLSDKNTVKAHFKNFTITSTAYIPYILSSRYLISTGLSDNETVLGVMSGSTIKDFISNIIVPDSTQMLQFFDGSTEITDKATVLKNGTKLIVTSGDKVNKVGYTISVGGGLESNAKITSAAYTVTYPQTGKWGKVANVPVGTTMKQLLNAVTVPSSATMTVVDADNMVLPTMKYNTDTNKIKAHEMSDVLVSGKVVFEVVAQNGIDTIMYAVELKKDPKAAVVVSDIYTVNESAKNINYIPSTTVGYFLNNLIASPGAKMKVVNKANQERTMGYLAHDDKLIVTSEDGTVTTSYYLGFMGEVVFDKIATTKSVGISVFPNPVSDRLTVTLESKASSIGIYNIDGKLFKQVVPTGNATTIDIRNLANGIYMVKIKMHDNTVATTKVVKL